MYRVADVEKAKAPETWLQPPRFDDEDVLLLKPADKHIEVSGSMPVVVKDLTRYRGP